MIQHDLNVVYWISFAIFFVSLSMFTQVLGYLLFAENLLLK